MRHRLPVLALVAGLGFAALGFAALQRTVLDPTRHVRDTIRAVARDPGSVTFGPITAGPRPGTFCGTFNAANGFGGRTGPVTFAAIDHGDRAITFATMDDWDRLDSSSDHKALLLECTTRAGRD